MGRATSPVEENWDSDEEEEERAVVAAEVVREEMEEEVVSLRLLALGPMCVFLCSAVNKWCVCGLSFLGSITFGASYEFPWARFTNFFIGVLGCYH